MKHKKSKSYPEEFKQSSAQLAYESPNSVKKTAIELGLNPSTLQSWVNKYYPTSEKNDSKKEKSSAEKELAILRKELLIVKQERDILKKASAYFASQMQ
jgi:transposase